MNFHGAIILHMKLESMVLKLASVYMRQCDSELKHQGVREIKGVSPKMAQNMISKKNDLNF